MKLVRKNAEGKGRLHINKLEIPCLDTSWHYHSEYELIYISKSNGVRFVGDSVSQFFGGDLVLVGPHLPHLWRNDSSYYKGDTSKKVEKVVVRFKKDFISEETFNIPEFRQINEMLERSKYGISFGKSVSSNLHNDLLAITELPAPMQAVKLLDILCNLSITKDQEILSASDMRKYTEACSERIDSVLKYVSDNYAKDISLKEVADIACMTSNSFCRAFKRTTQKSFTQFLNEVRVRNASRLLVQDDLMVLDVCHAVGYESVESFRKWFKQIMGTTPTSFRQQVA